MKPLCTFALTVMLCSALSGQQPAAAVASVAGIVVTTDVPPRPIRLARVTITRADGGRGAETATSDASGRFVFDALPAGRYAIQATKRAWLDANYGATRTGRPGTAVAVAAGERLDNITIAMSRAAVITGHVRDPRRQPVSGVAVSVLSSTMKEGTRVLARAPNTEDQMTDDEGAYRFYGLPPGDYLVMTAARGQRSGANNAEPRRIAAGEVDAALRAIRSGAAPPSAAAPGPALSYATVFFPGTPNPDEAAVITLAAGEERTGIDLPYSPVPTGRMSGTVSLPDGLSPMFIELRLVMGAAESAPPQVLTVGGTAVVPARGLNFVFEGIPAGRYTLFAAAGNLPQGGGPPKLLGFARTEVLTDGRDQQMTLDIRPPSAIRGRARFENGAPTDGDGIQIVLRALDGSQSTRLEPDGSFAFPLVPPGRVSISATIPPGSRWLLASSDLLGREVLDGPFPIQLGEAIENLVLTFTDRPSEVTGTLQSGLGTPTSDGFVVILPADRRLWTAPSRRIRSMRPGTDGVFSFKALPAGEYLLAVRADVEPEDLASPAFLAGLAATAVRVAVVEHGRTVQSIRWSER